MTARVNAMSSKQAVQSHDRCGSHATKSEREYKLFLRVIRRPYYKYIIIATGK